MMLKKKIHCSCRIISGINLSDRLINHGSDAFRLRNICFSDSHFFLLRVPDSGSQPVFLLLYRFLLFLRKFCKGAGKRRELGISEMNDEKLTVMPGAFYIHKMKFAIIHQKQV